MSSVRLAFAAAALLLFAGPAAVARDAGPSAVVNMTFGLKFEPATVRIRAGQTVEWRNKGFFPHTVTFDAAQASDPSHVVLPAGVAPFSSGKIGAGETWRHTFTTPGEYHYICQPHEDHEMLGVVIVAP
ncbi:MAG: cupredoxin domain-containing protein [Caulobacteraceae bacterium]|nr:cupredoxin domain-containing protein [Caulobacteraceae bacterium]